MSHVPDPFDDAAALDGETLELIAGALAAEPVPAHAAARVKHRLLERIAQSADSEARCLTVQAAADTWQPFQHGVQIKVLHEADGVMSYLLRLSAGAVVAAHKHPIEEECMVLEGSVRIGRDLVVAAGGFHLARRDTLHDSITSESGATLFLRGASPHPADLV